MPHTCHRPFIRTPLAAALLAALTLGAAGAQAASFAITGNDTTARTLGAGSGQTGTVAPDASLTVGGSTVAVAVTGNGATLTNLGTIAQTGTGRAVRANAAVAEFVINNGDLAHVGALIRSADADAIQMNVAASSVTLNNYGTVLSLNASAGGAQAVDFNAVTGANRINNYAGGLLAAAEADAVRTGANAVVFNAGTIRSVTATGASSDAIDGQANSGLVVTNGGLIDGGRHGITFEQASASAASTLDLTNLAGGTLRGNDGSGINVDGFNANQVVTVLNHGLISGNGISGDGDGIDVDGLVDIRNTGIIRSLNAVEPAGNGRAYSEGISAGGGRIVNAGTIEGLVAAGNTNAVGRGITLAGNDIASGPLAGTREGLYGNATIVNQAGGLIRGASDSAIAVTGAASGHTVTIENHASGVIRGGGTGTAAIAGGLDNTTIRNAGTIDGGSSGKAIALAGADNTVVIEGGNAVVLGGIDGGAGHSTLVVDAGAGNAFAYAGAIANFASVEVRSGVVTLSGRSTYGGTTLLTGGVLALQGADRIAADSALVLAGGTLDLTHAATQTFASLALTGDAAIALGAAALTFNGIGTIVAGETLAFTDAAGYTLRFLGDYAGDAAFAQLMRATTIDGLAVAYRFDGTYTTVSAVPEPANVAMLLAGLGLVGLAWRRRRAA